ncbi:MAG TPA: hypothetical protein VKG91_05890 [Roseiarcus sp.]|nr:hypothetical protein [Roseiarcus sp.]
MSTYSSGKKSESSASDFRGSAAQRIAVDSLKNIANVTITAIKPEVAEIIALLRKSSGALYIYDVADRLGWDSARAANAMSRGAADGQLTFIADDKGQTMVELAGDRRSP